MAVKISLDEMRKLCAKALIARDAPKEAINMRVSIGILLYVLDRDDVWEAYWRTLTSQERAKLDKDCDILHAWLEA
jgi:hypothetical protein